MCFVCSHVSSGVCVCVCVVVCHMLQHPLHPWLPPLLLPLFSVPICVRAGFQGLIAGMSDATSALDPGLG